MCYSPLTYLTSGGSHSDTRYHKISSDQRRLNWVKDNSDFRSEYLSSMIEPAISITEICWLSLEQKNISDLICLEKRINLVFSLLYSNIIWDPVRHRGPGKREFKTEKILQKMNENKSYFIKNNKKRGFYLSIFPKSVHVHVSREPILIRLA